MSIESINAAQQVANTQKKELAREEEVKTQIQSKGNTKEIVAALGVLASIGIATVAIIKSKNAKKELQEALKKAEEEKNKLAEEAKKAAEDAKKAAEDINKKVEEAVDKAKDEINKTEKPPKSHGGGGYRASGGRRGGRKPERTESPERTPHIESEGAPHVETERTPHVESEGTPHVETERTPHVESEGAPHVEFDGTPHVESDGIPHVEFDGTPHVESELTPHVIKPEPAISPKKPYTKPEIEAVEIRPEKTEEARRRQEQIEMAQLDYYQGTDMAQVARNILNEKPAPQVIDVLGNINLSKPLSKMTEKELLFEYKALKDAVQNLSVSDPAAKRFLEIKGELVNKRAFRVTKDGIVKREGVLDEYTKEGLEIIDKQEAEAKRAIEESDARNAEWVNAQQAKKEAEYEQMFLNAEKEQIDGIVKQLDEQEAAAKRAIEESDARNAEWVEAQRAKKEAEYEQMYLNAEREHALENGAKEVEGGNLDLLLDEVYPGYTKQLQEGQNGIIFVPQGTKLSNAVQRATDYVSEQWGKFRGLFSRKKPAVQEEKPFEPSVEGLSAWVEHLKNQRIENGKQIKEQVAKQLQDNSETIPIQEFIDSSVPRKHNKHYHNKLQKQYDKMAEELKEQETAAIKSEVSETPIVEETKSRAIRQPKSETQEPAVEIKEEPIIETPKVEPKPEIEPKPEPIVEPKPEPVAEPKAEAPKVEPKTVEETVAETVKKVELKENGLSEVDSLLVEREALTKSSTSIHNKRIEEINARLEELGAKDSKPNLENNVAKANYDVAYQKAELEYWQKEAEREEAEYQRTIKIMQEKNIQPLNIPMEEKQLIKEFLNKMNYYRRWKIEDPEYAQRSLARANEIKQLFKDKGKELVEPTTEELKLQYKLIKSEVGIITSKALKNDHARVLKEKTKTLNDLLQTSSEVSKKK